MTTGTTHLALVLLLFDSMRSTHFFQRGETHMRRERLKTHPYRLGFSIGRLLAVCRIFYFISEKIRKKKKRWAGRRGGRIHQSEKGREREISTDFTRFWNISWDFWAASFFFFIYYYRLLWWRYFPITCASCFPLGIDQRVHLSVRPTGKTPPLFFFLPFPGTFSSFFGKKKGIQPTTGIFSLLCLVIRLASSSLLVGWAMDVLFHPSLAHPKNLESKKKRFDWKSLEKKFHRKKGQRWKL